MSDLLDLVQESVVRHDADGRVTGWNAASQTLYGHSRSDAVGQPLHELLKTRRESLAGIEAALRAHGAWEGDVVRRTAADVAVTVRLKCFRHEGGFVETGIDVSAQRRAEDAMTRAEHRYSNVFQAMAVSFWELDFTPVGAMVQRLVRAGVADLGAYFDAHPDFVRRMIRATRVIDVNDLSIGLLGRGDKQEMLASLEPYWPEESQHVYAQSVVAAVQGRPHFATETRLTSIDGRVFDVWFTACFPPQMPARGKLLIGIIDISADKKAKTALETSEQRYRMLFHFLPVAMVQLDRSELAGVFETLRAEGVRDLKAYFDSHPGFYDYAANAIRVVEVNRRAVELFAAPDEADLTGPVARLWSEAGDVIRRSMAARFAGASRFEAEMKIRTFDGHIRDVLYVAYFPEAFGRSALGLSCLVDVSDRVAAQAALSQVQAEFTHAARVSMLGELTASIAHEVNQPLGAILTNGEAALRWLQRPEPDLEELRALSTRTVADARRAADIIRRIRGLATRGAPEDATLALNGVVEEVMLFLQPELRRRGVEAVLDLAPGLPDTRGDRVQFQQVLANLAVNAMQAMGERDGRRLTIRTALDADGMLAAEVEDTGPGIDPGHRDRLFDSFFTTKDGGMGIGLAICRSIVEAHGGRIDAVDVPHGACFRFTLPVARADRGPR
ncbi:MAG: ATP-binding protein [Rhizomicrobium sp.]